MTRGPLLLVLAAVLLASAALRFTGLDWLLPSLVEQDAHIPVQVRLMDGDPAEAARAVDWGTYPHLVARLTRLLTPDEDWSPPSPDASGPLDEHLARARWPVLRVRLVVALLSLLAVPATFLLARRFVAPGWSLLAAALVGCSLLAVHFGTQARAHGAALGLDTLAVLACMRLRRRGGAGDYALAGLAVAAAVACLQSGLATLLPAAVAHLGLSRERGRSHHLLLLVPLALLALTLLAFYPFAFQASRGDDGARLALEGGVLAQSKHQIFLGLFNGVGFVHMVRALWAWEPALALGSAGALLVLWLTRRAPRPAPAARTDRTVMLAFVLPYALAIGLYQRSYERFLLPLVPFLAVLVAYGFSRADAALRDHAARRVLLGGAAALLLGFPALVAARHTAARLAPSTFEQAAEWVQEHVEPARGTLSASRSVVLPLFKSRQALQLDGHARPDRGLGWTTYQREVLGDARPQPAFHLSFVPFKDVADLDAELARGPKRWVAAQVAELFVNEVYQDEAASLALTAITVALRETCERLARFSPDGDPDAWPVKLAYQDETTGRIPDMAWRVLHARRFGPVIEVFRLPGGAAAR